MCIPYWRDSEFTCNSFIPSHCKPFWMAVGIYSGPCLRGAEVFQMAYLLISGHRSMRASVWASRSLSVCPVLSFHHSRPLSLCLTVYVCLTLSLSVFPRRTLPLVTARTFRIPSLHALVTQHIDYCAHFCAWRSTALTDQN